MVERRKIQELEEEIEKLENKELNWENVKKLAILYTVKHHMCKELEMNFENDEESGIGFQSQRGSRGSESTNREIREITKNMNRDELEDVINRHARELNEHGNQGSYQRLYDRVRRYRR